MGFLKYGSLLEVYNKKQSTLLNEGAEKRYSAASLKKVAENFSVIEKYDIFLSHSYDDARIIRVVREMLIEKGFSVYVDWIEDYQLQRTEVTKYAANLLRIRMDCCSSLLYITSVSAVKSVWMPWELGYMDARTKRVAVAPIVGENDNFKGREYLGLYPYLDLTSNNFYIHSDVVSFVRLDEWFKGKNPA